MSEQKFGIIVDKEAWTSGEVKGACVSQNSIYGVLAGADAFERYDFYDFCGEDYLIMVFKGDAPDLRPIYCGALIAKYIPESTMPKEISKNFKISELSHVYEIPEDVREAYNALLSIKYEDFTPEIEAITKTVLSSEDIEYIRNLLGHSTDINPLYTVDIIRDDSPGDETYPVDMGTYYDNIRYLIPMYMSLRKIVVEIIDDVRKTDTFGLLKESFATYPAYYKALALIINVLIENDKRLKNYSVRMEVDPDRMGDGCYGIICHPVADSHTTIYAHGEMLGKEKLV